MKKLFTLLSLLFLLIVTPAFASRDEHSGSNSSGCNLDDEWKNHGEFVSCVAHEHRGGDDVSEAARSDVGKKFEDDEFENEDEDEDEIDDDDDLIASPSPT